MCCRGPLDPNQDGSRDEGRNERAQAKDELSSLAAEHTVFSSTSRLAPATGGHPEPHNDHTTMHLIDIDQHA